MTNFLNRLTLEIHIIFFFIFFLFYESVHIFLFYLNLLLMLLFLKNNLIMLNTINILYIRLLLNQILCLTLIYHHIISINLKIFTLNIKNYIYMSTIIQNKYNHILTCFFTKQHLLLFTFFFFTPMN